MSTDQPSLTGLRLSGSKPTRRRGRIIRGVQSEFEIDYTTMEKSRAIVKPGERIREQIMLENVTREIRLGNRYQFRDKDRNVLLLFSERALPINVKQWTSASISGGGILSDPMSGSHISVADRICALTIPTNEPLPDGHPSLKLRIGGSVRPATTIPAGSDPILEQVRDRVSTTTGLGRRFVSELFEHNGRLLYCPRTGFDDLSRGIIDHMVDVGFRRARKFALNDGETQVPSAIMIHDCGKRRPGTRTLAAARKDLANYLDARVQERDRVSQPTWVPLGGQFDFDFGTATGDGPSLSPSDIRDDLAEARAATSRPDAQAPEIP